MLSNNSIKILVVDDESKILDIIKSYLEKEGYVVYTAINGKEALDLFEKVKPNLAILDLMLPDISGEEVCSKIRKTSNIPIIMVTAKVEERDIINGLNIGADDYIEKPFSPRELVARTIALLRRIENIAMPMSNVFTFNDNDLEIFSSQKIVRKNGNIVNLTPKEYEILITLLKFPNKVFTREELIEKVFGYDFIGFDRTIDAHIKNLRHKIESDTKKPIYILTVHSIGYKFGGDKDEI